MENTKNPATTIHLLLLASLLTLTGCTSPYDGGSTTRHPWTRANTTPEQTAYDLAACRQKTLRNGPSSTVTVYQMLRDKQLIADCMTLKGYTLTPPPPQNPKPHQKPTQTP